MKDSNRIFVAKILIIMIFFVWAHLTGLKISVSFNNDTVGFQNRVSFIENHNDKWSIFDFRPEEYEWGTFEFVTNSCEWLSFDYESLNESKSNSLSKKTNEEILDFLFGPI